MIKLASRAAPVLVAATFALAGTAGAAMVTQTNTAVPATAMTAPQAQDWIQQITQRRLTRLHDRLRITAAEEPAWNEFAQTSMQNAASLDQSYSRRSATAASSNAVQNMESFARIQTQQAEDMQRLVPAFQSLYSKLTPQQQQIADDTFRANAERAEARTSQHQARMSQRTQSGQPEQQ